VRAVKLALALALLALAVAPAASAATPSPCVLVSKSDAAKVLGGKVGAGKAQTLGLYKSCTYKSGRKTLTVQTRAIPSKSAFAKSAKANPGPVFPVPGVGDSAYSAGAGAAFLVWKKGTENTFTFIGVSPVVQTQTDLANSALKHL
jgi:hypothetical protein